MMKDPIKSSLEKIGRIWGNIRECDLPITSTLYSEFERLRDRYKAESSSRDSEQDELRVALAGRFSTGKSSFINSLVGAAIAKEGEGATTHCRTVFIGRKDARKIEIVGKGKRHLTVNEYQKCCVDEKSIGTTFVVTVPTDDLHGLAIVDTPGYDPAPGRTAVTDKKISEDAVEECDVVFFLIKINDGTIVANNDEYLARVAKQKKPLYIVLSRADDKKLNGRRTVIETVRKDLDSRRIKYDGLLPYTALGEAALREATNNEENLEELMSYRSAMLAVLKDIQLRRSALKQRHIAGHDRAMAAMLVEYVNRLKGELAKSRSARRRRRDSLDISEMLQRISEEVAVIFTGYAEEMITNRLDGEEAEEKGWGTISNLVEWNEIPNTNRVWEWLGGENDRNVVMQRPGVLIRLTKVRKAQARKTLERILKPFGGRSKQIASEVLKAGDDLSVETSTRMVDTGSYKKRVEYKSECAAAEKTIRQKFARNFSANFDSGFCALASRLLTDAAEKRKSEAERDRDVLLGKYDAVDGALSSVKDRLKACLATNGDMRPINKKSGKSRGLKKRPHEDKSATGDTMASFGVIAGMSDSALFRRK